MSEAPVVDFRTVSKSYQPGIFALRDLSLAVNAGEFLTLLGPSGSGKTTALMILAGFETATSGEVLLRGREVTRVAPNRRGLGVVFQNYALFPHLTVAQNVAFPLRARSERAADVQRKVAATLERVRLTPFKDRLPSQLSGGQQQRVALARAMVFDPDVVLMDEPLAALDKNLRHHMQFEIKRLQRELGITVIYVTHDQTEALTMSDRVAVFDAGQLAQVGTPSDIYDRPASHFIATFIGETNSLDGTLVGLADGVAMVRLNDGQMIRGVAPRSPVRTGDRVVATVRPEQATLIYEHGAAAAGPDNVLHGSVSDEIFVGDHHRVTVRFASGDEFICKIGRDAAPHAFERGRASLRFLDTHALVFAGSDASPAVREASPAAAVAGGQGGADELLSRRQAA